MNSLSSLRFSFRYTILLKLVVQLGSQANPKTLGQQLKKPGAILKLLYLTCLKCTVPVLISYCSRACAEDYIHTQANKHSSTCQMGTVSRKMHNPDALLQLGGSWTMLTWLKMSGVIVTRDSVE